MPPGFWELRWEYERFNMDPLPLAQHAEELGIGRCVIVVGGRELTLAECMRVR
jgi:hypothetical protein